jgi:LysR family transcriptional activator of nhaA
MTFEWLNYHHLLYFWVVAREGGLAPAGKILRLSLPTISGQIRTLEAALDVQLFQKRGRRLELTELGRVAFGYADEIFGLGRELRHALRGQPIDRPLRLVVGISDVVPKLLVRRLLAPALTDPDRVALVCREERFDQMLAGLAAHTLDVVIADAPVPPAAAVRAFNHPLGQSTVSLVGPPALARALRRGFPGSIDGARVLLPLEGSVLRRNLDAWFAAVGVRPRVVAEAEDSALLKAFAADGMGLVFVPTVIADLVGKRYGLALAGRVDAIKERFYAISIERRIVHPAVLAIRDHARDDLFGA